MMTVGLVVGGGVVALVEQDGHELGSGVVEAAAFADRFELAEVPVIGPPFSFTHWRSSEPSR